MVRGEGQSSLRTNSSPCPRAPSSHPQRPPFPLCALSARFSCSLLSLRAHPLRQAPAAHPFCLGWRHTSSTPPSTQICAPSLLSPSSPAAALGADALPPTALSPGAAPPPGCAAAVKPPSVRAPSLAGERRGKCVRAAAPAFPARLLAGRLLACPPQCPCSRPGGGQEGHRFRLCLCRALPCRCSPSPFPAIQHSSPRRCSSPGSVCVRGPLKAQTSWAVGGCPPDARG